MNDEHFKREIEEEFAKINKSCRNRQPTRYRTSFIRTLYC